MISAHYKDKVSSDNNDDGRGSRSSPITVRASRLPFSVEALMSKDETRSEKCAQDATLVPCVIKQDERSVDSSQHCLFVKEESASWIHKPISTPPRKFPISISLRTFPNIVVVWILYTYIIHKNVFNHFSQALQETLGVEKWQISNNRCINLTRITVRGGEPFLVFQRTF